MAQTKVTFKIMQPELIDEFLFGAPLYAKYELIGSKGDSSLHLFCRPVTVDGHCFQCQQTATFIRTEGEIERADLDYRMRRTELWSFYLTCTRNREHQIRFVFRIEEHVIEKIGQYPSLADIANDESRTYRQVLERADASELHRAIGLAAHGVGVGSFVYIRRVFERLVVRRFREYSAGEGWILADFEKMRMDEKIDLLKDHLPEFLVKNKKLYSILSKGVHDLDEDECLAAFEMLKHSIFFILDEDKRKKQELERRRKAEQAIAKFQIKNS